MQWPWLSVSKQIWIRSSIWGTVCSCRSRGCKNIRGQSWRSMENCWLRQNRDCWALGLAGQADFFRRPTLTSDFFCSLLTYKNVQYLIWKIWFISVWRLTAKVIAWCLTWSIFVKSTLISYHDHTVAFVKTEVGCTVS